MGVLTKLAMLPLAPVTGIVWLAEQLERQAAIELYGPDAVRRQLDELEAAYEAGTISASERLELEDELLQRLEWGDSRG